MPKTVQFAGKTGSVHSAQVGGVGGSNIGMALTWKTCEITVSNTVVEQNGPYDDWEFGTVVRTGITITTDNFVVNSSHLVQLLPPWGTTSNQQVFVITDFAGGNSLSGTFCVTNLTLGNSDEASTENITLQSFGSITLT